MSSGRVDPDICVSWEPKGNILIIFYSIGWKIQKRMRFFENHFVLIDFCLIWTEIIAINNTIMSKSVHNHFPNNCCGSRQAEQLLTFPNLMQCVKLDLAHHRDCQFEIFGWMGRSFQKAEILSKTLDPEICFGSVSELISIQVWLIGDQNFKNECTCRKNSLSKRTHFPGNQNNFSINQRENQWEGSK